MEMKQESRDIEEQVVNSKISGTYRDNSLFHFLFDEHTGLNCKTRIKMGDNPVVYCAHSALTVLDDAIFPGYQLVEQDNRLYNHLSFYKIIVNDHHPLAKTYNPAHATLVYAATNDPRLECEFIVVHLNCNSHLQMLSIEAKAYPYHPTFHREGGGRKIHLNDQQKWDLQEQAKELLELLPNILNAKATAYGTLQNAAFRVSNELATLRAKDNNSIHIREKAEELRTIAIKLSSYDDSCRDGRVHAMTRLLEVLDFKERIQISQPRSADTTLHTETEQPLGAIPSTLKMTAKDKRDVIIGGIKTDIEALVRNIKITYPSGPISRDYVVSWMQLELLFMELELHPSAVTSTVSGYIETQRQDLLISTSLREYFEACIASGDLDAVQCIFPEIEFFYNLDGLFTKLITDMCVTKKESPLAFDAWPKIGQYLYENSELFRSELRLFLGVIWTSDEPIGGGVSDFGFGSAFSMFHHNNLAAFELMIRATTREITQLIMEGKHYNLLEAVILVYAINPNVQFIQALLSVMDNLRLPDIHASKVFSASATANIDKQYQKLIAYSKKQQPVFQAPRNRNALELANGLWREAYPDLIELLAQHASFEMTISSLSYAVNSTLFINRLVIAPRKILACFSSRIECDRAIHELGAFFSADSTLSSEGESQCCFLFFPTTRDTQIEHTLVSINHLITRLVALNTVESDSGLALQDNALRETIKRLSAKNTSTYWLAAQLCYLYIGTPNVYDHQTMLRLFTLIGHEAEKKYGNLGYYEKANTFLESLSKETRRSLANTPVYVYVMKKLFKLDPARFQLFPPALPPAPVGASAPRVVDVRLSPK